MGLAIWRNKTKIEEVESGWRLKEEAAMQSERRERVGSKLADRRYAVSRMIHWISVALVAALLGTALFGGIDPHGSGNGAFLWHSSLGLVLYLLMIFRVFWWFIYRPAASPADASHASESINRTLQLAFYGLLIALPISGWLLALEEGMHSSLLGLLALPQWYNDATVQHTAASADTRVTTHLMRIHAGLSIALFAVVVGHLVLAIRARRKQ